MATVTSRDTWLTVYHLLSKEVGPEKIVFDSELSSFNTVCETYVDDDAPLLNALVDDSPCRVLLLPSTRKGVLHVLHSWSYGDKRESGPYVIGIHGVQLTKPWKTVHSKHLIKPLKPPTSPRSSIRIPSLKQFFSISDADDFSKLNRDDTVDDIKDIESLPTGYLLHPNLFLTCVDDGSM
jgi:hypothetical protein